MPSHAIPISEPFFELDRARAVLRDAGLDALVASSFDNIYYLSGNLAYESVADPTSVSYAVLPAAAEIGAALIHTTTSGFNFEDFPSWPPRRVRFGSMHVIGAPPAEAAAATAAEGLARVLTESGLETGRIGFELGVLPQAAYAEIRALLPDLEIVDGTPALRALRIVKSPLEIALMRHAVSAVDRAITTALDEVAPGQTELDVDRRIRQILVEENVEPTSVFVGAGARGAQVLAWATDRVLARGDVIRVDVTAARGRHHADLSRNVAVGEASDQANLIYHASRAALEAAFEAVGPGVPVRHVFDAAVAAARGAGLPDFERHHVGHGVGLQVHEWPALDGGDGVIQPDSVLSIETPYYLHGVVGISPEDALLVRADGVERWTTAPYELPVIG